jgi:ankyrin repeat protein
MECLEPTMMRVKNRPSDETKTEIVRILQDRTDLTVQSKQGSTALAIACSNANVESVRLLCRNSEVNIADNDGSTPLLILLTHIRFSFTPEKHIGNIEEIVEILLTNGADTTVQDNRLDFYINRLIQDEELKTRLLEKVALARSGARGGATRKRKSKKSRRRKTRKARS